MAEKALKSKNDESDFKEEATQLQEPQEIQQLQEIQQPQDTKQQEMKYNIEDLSKASETIFKVKSECATAAFLFAGIIETTISEATKIINEFMNREVN